MNPIRITKESDLMKYTGGAHKGSINWRFYIGKQIIIGNLTLHVLDIDSTKRRIKLNYKGTIFDITIVEFMNSIINQNVNRIAFTHEDYVNYFKNGLKDALKYSHGSTKLIDMVCPICGEINKYRIADLINRGHLPCTCMPNSMSCPERVVYSLLKFCEISFNREVKFDWMNIILPDGKKTYGISDFVLEKEKIIIEVDGGFHYFNRHHDASNIQEKDFLKDKIARLNGYKTIRIDARYSDVKYLKENIIKSDLKKYIDMELVNWDGVFKESQTSLNLKVCEYRNQNPDKSIPMISKELKLSKDFVRSSLKAGNEIGICVYDSKVESSKSGKQWKGKQRSKMSVAKSALARSKKIHQCNKNKEIITTWNTMSDASEKTGIPLSNISKNCLGNRKSAGGYIWMFAS